MNRLVFLLSLSVSVSAWANKPAVAVLDIQGTGVPVELLPTLTEVLTVEIDNLDTYKVIGGRDVQAMLGFERQKDIVGCADAACLAEIGGALGVDRIVTSHIGKVGSTYVVNIKLINIRLASTEGRVYETVRGEEDALLTTIRKSVTKLLGKAQEPVSAAAATKLSASEQSPPAASQEGTATAVGDAAEGAVTAGVTGEVATDGGSEGPDERGTEPELDDASTMVADANPVAQVERDNEAVAAGWLPVSLWAAGGVAVGAGTFFGFSASAHESSFHEKGLQVDAATAHSHAKLANIMFGVGAAMVVGGVAAWLLSDSGGPTETALLPVAAQDAAGLAVCGSF